MKPFKFTLQTLYNVKETIEKEQEMQLQLAIAKLQSLQAELLSMQQNVEAAQQQLRQEIKKGSSAKRLISFSHYFERMKATIDIQKQRIQEAEKEREIIHKKLIETRKEIRSLEKLRERQYEEYLIEQKREEEKMIGDIVSYQAASGS